MGAVFTFAFFGAIIFCVLLIILVFLLLIINSIRKKKKIAANLDSIINKLDFLTNALNSEFERNRREMQSSQNASREEITKRLTEMNDKIEQLKLDTAVHQSEQDKMLVESLNTIRLNNIEQNEKQMKAVAESIERMTQSNEKKLEEMRATVDEKLTNTLSQRLDSSFKTVSDRLESVNKSLGEMKELSNGVTANVTTLNRVLTNVKARGTWAEIQLASILDQTIPGMYETNFAPTEGSRDRVEFAVRIPSGEDGKRITYLPIDSKFPMEDYIKLCDAADSADAEQLAKARKALEARVYEEAKTITKYINVPKTTPYAILYLATEGLYAEIVSSRSGIAERIRSELNIMIAGPTTVTALLNSLSLGFRAVAINEKANEVRLLLAAAKVQYDKFGVVLDKARQKIADAGKSLDEAGKRNDIIRKKLNKVEEIDGMNAEEILGLEETSDI